MAPSFSTNRSLLSLAALASMAMACDGLDFSSDGFVKHLDTVHIDCVPTDTGSGIKTLKGAYKIPSQLPIIDGTKPLGLIRCRLETANSSDLVCTQDQDGTPPVASMLVDLSTIPELASEDANLELSASLAVHCKEPKNTPINAELSIWINSSQSLGMKRFSYFFLNADFQTNATTPWLRGVNKFLIFHLENVTSATCTLDSLVINTVKPEQ